MPLCCVCLLGYLGLLTSMRCYPRRILTLGRDTCRPRRSLIPLFLVLRAPCAPSACRTPHARETTAVHALRLSATTERALRLSATTVEPHTGIPFPYHCSRSELFHGIASPQERTLCALGGSETSRVSPFHRRHAVQGSAYAVGISVSLGVIYPFVGAPCLSRRCPSLGLHAFEGAPCSRQRSHTYLCGSPTPPFAFHTSRWRVPASDALRGFASQAPPF